jgi:drug/metabolite transporter (DMT)-like permease
MPNKSHPVDWLMLAALVVAWGSSFAMIKIAVTHLDAAWVMALRLAIAALVLAPYALFSGHSLAAMPAIWGKFTWLGLIGNVLPFFLIIWGTHFVSSGVSGLLMGSVPLFLLVLAHFTLADERLTVPKTIGFLMGFAGVIVLIGPGNIFNFSMSGEALWGELAILAGCLCYAIHAVTAKQLGFEHPIKQSAGVCIAAAIMGLIFAAVVSPQGLAGKPPVAFWAVAGLGLLPTAFATLLMYRLMERIGPTFIAYSNYLVPVYAVLLGAAVLGEQLSWNVLAALVLVLIGIAVSRLNTLPSWSKAT